MNFEEWYQEEIHNNKDNKWNSFKENMELSWDAAIDEAVKATEESFELAERENLVSLEETTIETIKELKQ